MNITSEIFQAQSLADVEHILTSKGVRFGKDLLIEFYPARLYFQSRSIFMHVWVTPETSSKEVAHWIPDLGTMTIFTPYRPYGLAIQGICKSPHHLRLEQL